MAKDKPITSSNRTKILIKKLLKSLRKRPFSNAFNFSQLKFRAKKDRIHLRLKFGFKNWLKKQFKRIAGLQFIFNNKLVDNFISNWRSFSTLTITNSTAATSTATSEQTTVLTGWGLKSFAPLWHQFWHQLLKWFQEQWKKLKPSGPKPILKLSFEKKKKPLIARRPSFSIPWSKGAIYLLSILILCSLSYGFWWYLLKDLPHPNQLAQADQMVTSKILAKDGTVLFKFYETENRSLVSLEELPQTLIDATIAIEDKSFYQHRGFSPRGIIRAALANSQGKAIEQGGSTITQQLVKNRLLSSERTFQRKLKEVILSIWAETIYSKEQILEMYFNQVAYGGAVYGIEEAAQRYFGKDAQNLTLAESAMLAGLPVAPSVYSPFAGQPEMYKKRQTEVLRRMTEDGYISKTEAETALAEPLNYQEDAFTIKAPHFVMYVKDLLAKQYGSASLYQGGLEVTTTLDWPLQQKTQKLVTAEVNKLTKLKVGNGAALVTNPQTGEILAMVGSKNYFDFEHDGQVNVTLRPRQPGSSIKPLTYALALEAGQTPNTIIDDSPITYQTAGSKPYSPVNYDGRFRGRVTLREALASSYNVPAVKTLATLGVETMLDQGQAMGIDTWEDRQRFGLSLTLGGGEVTMVDMAELYSAFANNGYNTLLNPILEVKNARGETLYRNTCVLEKRGCPQTKTISAATAYQITDILADNQARTPAFGSRSVLYIPGQEVAVKTGTTNNLRDNWTIGYTSNRLVATWVGNNDNSPMSYVASGITGASPIWNQIMRSLLDANQPHRFNRPESLIKVQVCVPTGTLPCPECPLVKEEFFKPGAAPTQNCHADWFDKTTKPGKLN